MDVLCYEHESNEYLELNESIAIFSINDKQKARSDLHYYKEFVADLDVVIVDEAAYTVGEFFKQFTCLCQDKIQIVAFHSLGFLSDDKDDFLLILSQFTHIVAFRSNLHNRLVPLVEPDVSHAIANLPIGSACLLDIEEILK